MHILTSSVGSGILNDMNDFLGKVKLMKARKDYDYWDGDEEDWEWEEEEEEEVDDTEKQVELDPGMNNYL